MKDYRERVGDRWQDPEDMEIVEIIRVSGRKHWIESIANGTSFIENDGPYSNTTIDDNAWKNWVYLGNFSKAIKSRALYNKLL